ncbi:hypothetical protein G6F60_014598 [Rhizopus arrhizus]|nr:hypothetical protein G6F60_014598 [Rhizopus arrhizus]
MALEPEIQRIVLRDARAVLGGASPEAQRHCVQSMQRLIERLIAQGVVTPVDAQALASLIYGSLAEAAIALRDPVHQLMLLDRQLPDGDGAGFVATARHVVGQGRRAGRRCR